MSSYGKLTPMSTVASFYELSAPLITGKMEFFSKYEGRIVLVVNIASADQKTSKELNKLNEWVSAYEKNGLSVFAFPCDQFASKEPFENDEIPLILEHVRPGGRFYPSFKLFSKCDVNGARASPVFEYLKMKIQFPLDDETTLMRNYTSIGWSPVTRQDLGWNFEKFLVNFDGQPIKRYSHKCTLDRIGKDLEFLLKKIPRSVREQSGITHLQNQNVTIAG